MALYDVFYEAELSTPSPEPAFTVTAQSALEAAKNGLQGSGNSSVGVRKWGTDKIEVLTLADVQDFRCAALGNVG
jgi:hypothetical protein